MTKSGFTLIEMVVYLALVASLLASAVVVTDLMLKSRGRVESALLAQEQLSFALGRMRRHVEQAADITLPVLGQPTSTLRLAMTDASLNPTIVSWQNGTLFMQRGAEPALALTSQEISLTNVAFTRLASTPPQVQIAISARPRQSLANSTTTTVAETVSIRR